MADIIENILKGQYKKENGTLEFSCAGVEAEVSAGGTFDGSITLYAPEGIVTEGRVYSTDTRMECLTDSFSGTQDEIGYRFHTECIGAGQTVKGQFIIVSNQGEYMIPFTVHITVEVMDSSLGPIRNLFHFVNLAKLNWDEALKLFYSKEFESIFCDADKQYYAAYKGLSGVPGSSHNMEEFLIEINKKRKIEFIPETDEIRISNPLDNMNHIMRIESNGWGYIYLRFETDGDFIKLEHNEATDRDFLGNEYQLAYVIDNSKLHAGLNCGEIRILYCHDTIHIPVNIENGYDMRSVHKIRRENEELTIELMKYYIAARSRKISQKTWLAQSDRIVDRMLEIDRENLIAQLYKVQILITEDKLNEARWILDRLELEEEDPTKSTPETECYRMYLRALVEQNTEITFKAANEISSLYTANSESWRIAFLLTQISEEFSTSPTRKWLFIEEQLSRGCSSPVMYAEACRLLARTPTLLTRLDNYELSVLGFAAKNGMMTRDILIQFVLLAKRIRKSSKQIVKVLEISYLQLPDDEILSMICSQLIESGKTDSDSFDWYSKGVERELRITNLFDYYMMSFPQERDIDIPRMVLMYFSYQSNLEENITAFLYAYVWKRQEEMPELFAQYHPRISQFTSEMLENEKISRNLAYLYCNVIDNDQFTEHIAEKFSKVMFINELTTSDESIRNVYVSHMHLSEMVQVPVSGGRAFLPIYDQSVSIILEDYDGNRFTNTIEYSLEEFINPAREKIHVSGIVKNDPGLDDFMCYSGNTYMNVTEENVSRVRRMAVSPEFNRTFMRDLCLKLIKYYYDNDMIEELDTFLAMLTPDMVDSDNIAEIIFYFVKRGMSDKAYEWMQYTSQDSEDPGAVLCFCSEILKEHPDMSDDRILQQYMAWALSKGKYDECTLNALVSDYSGSIRHMRDIWKSAMNYNVDTRPLEKRILEQMLYTGSYIAERWEILKDYRHRNVSDDDVVRATAIQCCYDSFVRERVMDAELFRLIGEYAASEITLPIVCGLAYVQYYSENLIEIDDAVRENIKRFLVEQHKNGIVLPCYRQFADYLPFMMQYSDKTIIGYHAKHGSCVRIHYVLEQDEGEAGDYSSENMQEIYEGFFVRTFVIFFGEQLQYYITQNDSGNEQLTDSGTLSRSDIDSKPTESRFSDLNSIMIARNLHDYDTVDNLLGEYFRRGYIISQIFRRK